MLRTINHNPRRGEIWDVNFDSTIGTEIQKKRPAVVVNVNSIRHLKIRLIAPITSWNKEYSNKIWFINIKPDDFNGLRWESAVDTMQIKGADLGRFREKLGRLTAAQMDDITAAIAAIIGYQ